LKRKLFLDVGGHYGETAAVALGGDLAFDAVHTFEPDPECVARMQRAFEAAIEAGRLILHPVALGGADGEITLFGDNARGGASVVAGMLRDNQRAIRVAKIDIARFLETHTTAEDSIFVKLNCEGGEVEILNRLHQSARIAAVRSIMADFDIVKSSGGYFQKRRVLRLYRAEALPLALSEEVMVGRTHAERIKNWLAYFPEAWRTAPGSPRRQLLKRRLRYWLRDLRSALHGRSNGYR
jgi:FkbM family methyltransferase